MNKQDASGRYQHAGAAEQVADFDTRDSIDIRAILRTFWRRKWAVISSALLFVVVTLLVVVNQTPLYTATATLMLNTRQSNVVDVDAVLSGLPANATQVLNEIEVLQSGRLIERVVDKLRLDRDPEFNDALIEDEGGVRYLDAEYWAGLVRTNILEPIGASPNSDTVPDIPPDEQARLVREGVLDAVRAGLSVQQVSYSVAITVSFTSQSPKKASLIANTIAEQYLVDQLEAKFEATSRATTWLNDRLSGLKTQVEASEAAVEAFNASVGAGAGQGAAVVTQQLTQLNAELVLARAQRAEAEARYERIAELLQQRGASAAADAISSPLIQSLRQQMAELRRREAELATRYTARHPTMINIRAEISDTASAVAAEVRKVVLGLKTELEVARSRERALQESVQSLEDDTISQNRAFVELRQLEREAEANRLIYESFLSRFKETEDQEGLAQADAQLISKAQAPLDPSYPNKPRSIALAGFGGIVFGVLVALLLEQLDNAYRTARQIELDLGLVTLGVIPRMKGRKDRRVHLDYVVSKPTSMIAEAFRGLRSALFLTNVDAPPRIIAVASSLPGEGKTTVSLLLAQTSAKLGKSVLLVDCDLRRPTLHETFASDDGPSLVELLSGEACLDEVVRHDEASGLNFIPSRSTAASAIDLLSSQRFADLVRDFRARFDTVVLDGPPTLVVSDSVPIAKQADAVIFVVKWNGAAREAVRSGVRALTDRGVVIDGVVLSQVDVASQARYGYGEAAGYYGRYRQYYQN